MPQIHVTDLLQHAYRHSYAVSAFDAINLEVLEAIVAGAELSRSPLILCLTEPHSGCADFELLSAAAEIAARRATVPIALHLDRGESLDSAIRAVNLGCNSISEDTSSEPLTTNIERTRKVVAMARDCGVAVGGTLGSLNPDGSTQLPDPATAKHYVDDTGVDFLALALGPVHQRGERPTISADALRAIHNQVERPLALSGGRGLTAEQAGAWCADGVTLIHHYTVLVEAIETALRNATQANRHYPEMLDEMREAIASAVVRCQQISGAAGRADQALNHCQPWREVEHLIIYNVSDATSETDIADMMAEGQRTLSAIPGVRRVFTGTAVKDDAEYRHTWLVRFTHENVIASYRDHPDHINFADTLFRPRAANRISIDYLDQS